MTIHTALDIRPAYDPRTHGEMIAADKERERKWREAAQKRAMGRVDEKSDVVVRIYNTAPVERVWTAQHDAHVMSYLEWKGNEPLGFLKLRCRELDVSYKDIVHGNLNRKICKTRGDLIAEVKTRYPDMALTEMGVLFGGMDHTSIRTALLKRGVISGDMTRSYKRALCHADTILQMLEAGMPQYRIAIELKTNASAISQVITHMGWQDVSPKKRDKIDLYSEEIRALFDKGLQPTAIGRAIGAKRSSVRDFIRRMGWTR